MRLVTGAEPVSARTLTSRGRSSFGRGRSFDADDCLADVPNYVAEAEDCLGEAEDCLADVPVYVVEAEDCLGEAEDCLADVPNYVVEAEHCLVEAEHCLLDVPIYVAEAVAYVARAQILGQIAENCPGRAGERSGYVGAT